jgi:hypothetical protein
MRLRKIGPASSTILRSIPASTGTKGEIRLFVLDGDGYTVVDGEKMEWE